MPLQRIGSPKGAAQRAPRRRCRRGAKRAPRRRLPRVTRPLKDNACIGTKRDCGAKWSSNVLPTFRRSGAPWLSSPGPQLSGEASELELPPLAFRLPLKQRADRGGAGIGR